MSDDKFFLFWKYMYFKYGEEFPSPVRDNWDNNDVEKYHHTWRNSTKEIRIDGMTWTRFRQEEYCIWKTDFTYMFTEKFIKLCQEN